MIDEVLLKEFIDILKKHSGIDFQKGNIQHLKKVLKLKSKKFNLKDYLNLIKRDNKALADFVDEITIGETYFFRNLPHFDALKYILKEVFKDKNKIIIWSAACSIGAEPYSIAIIANEYIPDKFNKDKVKIIATDISRNFLSIAKKGIYSKRAVEIKTPINYIKKYFTFKDNRYYIKDSIKGKVFFTYLNLLKDSYFTNIDIIFLRNVLIYFSKEDIEKVLFKFHKSLNEGGFLFLGSSEFLPDKFSAFFERVNIKNAYIYKKWTTDRRKSSDNLPSHILDKRRLKKEKPIIKVEKFINKVIVRLIGVFDDYNFSYDSLKDIEYQIYNYNIKRIFVDLSKVDYISNRAFYMFKLYIDKLTKSGYIIKLYSSTKKIKPGLAKLYDYIKRSSDKNINLLQRHKEINYLLTETKDSIKIILKEDMFKDKKDAHDIKKLLALALSKGKNVVIDFSKVKVLTYNDIVIIKRAKNLLESEGLKVDFLYLPSMALKYFK